MIDRKLENAVLDFIVNTTEPIHSTDIANALGINRVTATKYLSVLQSKSLIDYKNVGMAKVWMHIENPLLLAFEKNDLANTTIQTFNNMGEGVCVLDRDFEIIWFNTIMEKKHGKLAEAKGKKCFDVFHREEEICSNCPIKKTFETGKAETATVRSKKTKIEISSSPLKNKKGKVIAAIEIVRYK